MATIEDDLEAAKNEELAAWALILFYQKSMTQAVRSIERQVDILLDEGLAREGGRVAGRLKDARKLHKELGRIFQEEYDPEVASLLVGLSETATALQEKLRIFVPGASLRQDMINALRAVAQRELDALGAVAIEELASALYEATITGAKYETLRQQISAILTGERETQRLPLTTKVERLLFEQVMAFRTRLTVAAASIAGINEFLYYGFIQDNTRSFCLRRVGKIYAKTAIESWTHDWVGKSGPAMTHRGGYNCKHTWIPVRKDWYGENKKEITNIVRVEPEGS